MNTAASAQYQFQGQPGREQALAIPIGAALSVARQIETGRSSPGVHIGPTAYLGVAVWSSGVPGAGTGVAGTWPVSEGAPRPGCAHDRSVRERGARNDVRPVQPGPKPKQAGSMPGIM